MSSKSNFYIIWTSRGTLKMLNDLMATINRPKIFLFRLNFDIYYWMYLSTMIKVDYDPYMVKIKNLFIENCHLCSVFELESYC